MALDVVGQIVQGLLYMFWLVLGCSVLFYVLYVRQFKHKLIERHQTNNGDLIQVHKVREYKDRDKIKRWQKLKGFEKISCPPSECVNIDFRGRKVVEAVVSTEGNYRYLKINSAKENALIEGLSTEDRQSMLMEIEKAHAYKKKSIGELIMTLAPLVSVTLLVVCLMIFWGDIAQPVLNAQQMQNNYAEIQTEQLELLRDIKLGIQTIDEKPAPGEAS